MHGTRIKIDLSLFDPFCPKLNSLSAVFACSMWS